MTNPLNIELIQVEDTSTKRGGGKRKGQKYGKYTEAASPYIDQLLQLIDDSKDKLIRVKTKEMAKQLGKDFEKLHETSIYWGLKHALFYKGISVETGTHRSGEKLVIMRRKTEDDVLPGSLKKKEGERKEVVEEEGEGKEVVEEEGEGKEVVEEEGEGEEVVIEEENGNEDLDEKEEIEYGEIEGEKGVKQ